MIGIYKITSPTGKVYIGQSINIEARLKQYKNSDCKRQIKLHRSLLKYGSEKHNFEIICECLEYELNEKERYYQDIFECIGKNGLNCKLTASSDRSGKHSEETKLKIKEANNRLKIWVGRKHKPESILKMSESSKNQSLETRKKISQANKGKKNSEFNKEASRIRMIGNKYTLGFKHSKETIDKMKIDRKGINQKLILNIDNGVFHYGAKEASICYSINYSTLRGLLNGNNLSRKINLIYI